MHEKDTVTEIKVYIAIQMTLVHVLDQRRNKTAKWTAQVCNGKEYVCINVTKPGKSWIKPLLRHNKNFAA